MIRPTPQTWSREQYEAFVMLVAASGDLTLKIEEKRPIMALAGEHWNDLLNLFRDLNDAERIHIVMEGRDTHLKTEADRELLLQRVKEVFMADNDYADIERGVMSILRRIL